MSLPHEYQCRLGGSLLVLLQFGLLLWLAVMAVPKFLQGPVGIACCLLAVLSAALAAWTLLHNRIGNFNIHPAPKAGGMLVTSGPYRWMRHPMYSSVLLGAAAMACLSDGPTAGLVWVALFLVLLTKSALEEHWLRLYHPQYQAYCRQCKRFVPGIF